MNIINDGTPPYIIIFLQRYCRATQLYRHSGLFIIYLLFTYSYLLYVYYQVPGTECLTRVAVWFVSVARRLFFDGTMESRTAAGHPTTRESSTRDLAPVPGTAAAAAHMAAQAVANLDSRLSAASASSHTLDDFPALAALDDSWKRRQIWLPRGTQSNDIDDWIQRDPSSDWPRGILDKPLRLPAPHYATVRCADHGIWVHVDRSRKGRLSIVGVASDVAPLTDSPGYQQVRYVCLRAA